MLGTHRRTFLGGLAPIASAAALTDLSFLAPLSHAAASSTALDPSENAFLASRDWRPHLLASTVHALHGTKSDDSPVLVQSREALKLSGK